MIGKILVPIAFSKYSKGIIRFAAQLAAPTGARLLIANVVNERDLEAVERIASYGYKVDGDHYIATIQKERVALLEEMVAELGLGDDDYDYVFVAGDPTTELIRLVLRERIDLVVMGTRAKGLQHIFTGSVAERMFRKCPISVAFHREGDVSEGLTRKFKRETGMKE